MFFACVSASAQFRETWVARWLELRIHLRNNPYVGMLMAYGALPSSSYRILRINHILSTQQNGSAGEESFFCGRGLNGRLRKIAIVTVRRHDPVRRGERRIRARKGFQSTKSFRFLFGRRGCRRGTLRSSTGDGNAGRGDEMP